MTEEQFSILMDRLDAIYTAQLYLAGGVFVLLGMMVILAFFIGMGSSK